jgi:hypothetical protein
MHSARRQRGILNVTEAAFDAQTLDCPLVRKRDNVCAVRSKTALNVDQVRRPARRHAEGDSCESLDDTLHQRWACAAKGLDATPDDHSRPNARRTRAEQMGKSFSTYGTRHAFGSASRFLAIVPNMGY